MVRSWSAPKDPRSIILRTVTQDEWPGLVHHDVSALQSDVSPKPDDVVDPHEQTEKWANVWKTFGTHCEFLVRPCRKLMTEEKQVQRRILFSEGGGVLRFFLRLSLCLHQVCEHAIICQSVGQSPLSCTWYRVWQRAYVDDDVVMVGLFTAQYVSAFVFARRDRVHVG